MALLNKVKCLHVEYKRQLILKKKKRQSHKINRKIPAKCSQYGLITPLHPHVTVECHLMAQSQVDLFVYDQWQVVSVTSQLIATIIWNLRN